MKALRDTFRGVSVLTIVLLAIGLAPVGAAGPAGCVTYSQSQPLAAGTAGDDELDCCSPGDFGSECDLRMDRSAAAAEEGLLRMSLASAQLDDCSLPGPSVKQSISRNFAGATTAAIVPAFVTVYGFQDSAPCKCGGRPAPVGEPVRLGANSPDARVTSTPAGPISALSFSNGRVPIAPAATQLTQSERVGVYIFDSSLLI